MKAYILKIVGAALIAAFSEYLVPEGWQKYMKLISGFIIITVLISPFTGAKSVKLFDDFKMEEEYIQDGEELMYENIKEQLEKDVAEDIKKRVSEEFSKEVEARVTVKTNSEGKIESVERIEIEGKKDDKITERLKYVYGTEEVIWI